LCLTAFVCVSASFVATAAQPRSIPQEQVIQRQAVAAFNEGSYERVIGLLEQLPSDQQSPGFLRMGVMSLIRVGRSEAALTMYHKLVPKGHPDDKALLLELAQTMVRQRVRDPQEYLRGAAYTALTDAASIESLPLFEDGLLDSSVLVKAQAVVGLGQIAKSNRLSVEQRDHLAAAVRRALQDGAPSVQIAALTVLGDLKDATVVPLLKEMVRKDEGPVGVFASAALVKLGDPTALSEILSAATLPDAQARTAALAVLGDLKRTETLSVLSQSVYDPDPSVRAFAAAALGEFGRAEVASSLTHALGDDSPRVRSIAAASLGKLRLPYTRPLLRQSARDAVEMVRVGAIEGLLRLGETDAILLAADLARHADPGVRSATAEMLGHVGNRKALRILDTLLRDQQPQPRLTAARASGKIGDPAATASLKRALQDSEPAVQITAAGALARVLGTKR
jgi:HEAT repeat protein